MAKPVKTFAPILANLKMDLIPNSNIVRNLGIELCKAIFPIPKVNPLFPTITALDIPAQQSPESVRVEIPHAHIFFLIIFYLFLKTQN